MASKQDECRLGTLNLKAGMPRAEAEGKIAALQGVDCSYSFHTNSLRGGPVLYRDRGKALRVIYNPGIPPMWVKNGDGVTEHHPAIDETVLSYELLNGASPR